MPVDIKNGQTIVFIGDSITDCGRRGTERPLGNGYVKLFADLLMIREPQKQVRIINRGIGGDTVTGLRDRWTDDVLRHRPDWLSVKIGINDLHRTLSQNPVPIPPELYREAYDNILSRTRQQFPKCRILLIDSFYISREDSTSSFRRQVLDLLPKYLDVVHAMSRQYKTRLVKTQELFQKVIGHYDPDTFYGDAVHPNLSGHLLIAEAVYDALSS